MANSRAVKTLHSLCSISKLPKSLHYSHHPGRTVTSASRLYHTAPLSTNIIERAARAETTRAWVPTPYVTETIAGGSRTHDIFSRLLMERIICLNGPVDESMSASIVAQLLFLEADAPDRPISLYINSPGGSVTAGLAIYDTMTYIRSAVTTTCVGQAASMGSLLLCGGAPGKRFCLPHSSVMVHQPSGGYFGQASDIAIHAKEILRVRGQLNEIYRRHLTRPHSIEEIERLMERDRFLSAEEAKEIGLIDQILDTRGHEAKIDPDIDTTSDT